jgi:hypothetical protein
MAIAIGVDGNAVREEVVGVQAKLLLSLLTVAISFHWRGSGDSVVTSLGASGCLGCLQALLRHIHPAGSIFTWHPLCLCAAMALLHLTIGCTRATYAKTCQDDAAAAV